MEAEERIASAGRDLAVISELDRLTSGVSHLLSQMAATPALLPYLSSIALLQRYSLETCRNMEMLERSMTGRFANHTWRLNSSVPKQTRESLRQAPLLSNHLFPQETVAIAGQNLRGDVQHQNLSRSLKLFTATKPMAGKKAPSQPHRSNIPTQQPPKAAGRGRGGQRSRGKSSKSSRGRGKGKQGQAHS